MSDGQSKGSKPEDAGGPAESPRGSGIRRHEPGIRWDDRRRRPGERRAKPDRRDEDRRRNPDRRTEDGDRRRKDGPFPPPDRRQISNRRIAENRRQAEDRRVGDRRKTPDRRKGRGAEKGGQGPVKTDPRDTKQRDGENPEDGRKE